MALINKLEAIADAIRAKTGGTTELSLDDMVDEIEGISGGGSSIQDIELTGDLNKLFYQGRLLELWDATRFRITTRDITIFESMFLGCRNIQQIPFTLNLEQASYNTSRKSSSGLFRNCQDLRQLPAINWNNNELASVDNMFNGCYRLKNIPDNYINNVDYTYFSGNAGISCSAMFHSCYSLRQLPAFFTSLPATSGSNTSRKYYYYMCTQCYVLDDILMPVANGSTMTANMFGCFCADCFRVRHITFVTNENNIPKTASWKNQNMDLTSQQTGLGGTGWCRVSALSDCILPYNNSEFSLEKFVDNQEKYLLLKDDPEYIGTLEYSRYNHDSAVETINSLPDTSAYLATAGGTNTINFKGDAGSATDGGAINTLTAEEIAVATAKGWTVTFS